MEKEKWPAKRKAQPSRASGREVTCPECDAVLEVWEHLQLAVDNDRVLCPECGKHEFEDLTKRSATYELKLKA